MHIITQWVSSHQKKRIGNDVIRQYIIEKLNLNWSPEQIAGRLPLDKPGLKTNYESIYLFIYEERHDLIKNLRKSHRKRHKRGYNKGKRAPKIPNRITIAARPKSIDERIEPGHWEADTMISRASKASLQVIHERKTGYIKINKLEAKTANEMRVKLNRSLCRMPEVMRKSVTFDNGTENCEHEIIAKTLNVNTYFCNPYHSWEKGSVENSIGLIRQYFPKKTDFTRFTNDDIKHVERLLNERPRKRLGFKKPKEVFSESVALGH